MIFKGTTSVLPGLILFSVWSLAGLAQANDDLLQPWPQNLWYWSRGGQPTLLLGGSDDDNLFQWPEEKLIPQLDRIVAAGGNVVRNTMSDRQDGGFEEYAFLRLPGGKHDLRQWNPTYWSRFERFLKETAKRDIVVQIEVWDRFDFTDVRANDPRRWEKKHPFNPQNNVNYSFDESGFAPRYPDHPGANKQPFFYTTPEQRNNKVVLPYQQRFVDKLLDYTLQHDHVLYCIDNETKAEPAWGAYWARYIRKRANDEGRQVMVTEMWDDWDLKAPRHRQTFDHPELYDYVDVSQNNQNRGQAHWDNFIHVRDYLSRHPRPMNTTKTYGADGNKFKHTDQDAIERFWRHLLAGAASIRFHRPPSGLGINDKAAACIKAARLLEKSVPIWELEPRNDLLLSREENEAYCAATSDLRRLAVYFPASSKTRQVGLKLADSSADYRIEWIDIDRGTRQPTRMNVQDWKLSPPSDGNFVATLLTDRSEGNRTIEKKDLVAWCIVPFDAKKRGPAERARMVKSLGLSRVAYDWRKEHIRTFEEEILQYKKHGIEFFAFWDWHPTIASLIQQHQIQPQIWKTNPSPRDGSDSEKIAIAAKQLLPLVKQTEELGLKLGLYNHGGWGGRPKNMVAVCEHLRRVHETQRIGIVYNLHHAHQDMTSFRTSLALMTPYLMCLNLNGMTSNEQLLADPAKKILPIGSGANDLAIVQEILNSQYRGPIGILDHRSDVDAEISLRRNLDGLNQLLLEPAFETR